MILGINGIRTGCDFPLWMHYTLIIYMLSFIALFGNFYVKAYINHVSVFKLYQNSIFEIYGEFLQGNKVFFGMDMGCGQGNTFSTNKQPPSASQLQNDKKVN